MNFTRHQRLRENIQNQLNTAEVEHIRHYGEVYLNGRLEWSDRDRHNIPSILLSADERRMRRLVRMRQWRERVKGGYQPKRRQRLMVVVPEDPTA